MKRLIVLLLWLVLTNLAVCAQKLSISDLPESYYKHMTGRIKPVSNPGKDPVQVTMNMRRRGDFISGTYFYESDTLSLSLNGVIDKKSAMYEFEAVDPEYNLKGTFRGAFYDEKTMRGMLHVPKSNGETEKWHFELVEDYTNSVKFDVFQMHDRHYIEDNPDYPYIDISIDYLHPSDYQDKSVLNDVQILTEKEFFGKFAFENNPEMNIQRKRRESFNEYRQYVERNYTHNPEMVELHIWESEYVSDVVYNSDNILTLKVKSQENVGGEAQFGGINYLVIDMNTGDKIKLEDIFKDGYEKAVSTIITEKIKEDMDINSDIELIEQEFLIDMIVPNENYYIDRKGIGFYFKPYAINEYEVTLYISYEEMGRVLKKKSIISRFFPDDMKFSANDELVAMREDLLKFYRDMNQQQGPPDPFSNEFTYDDTISGNEGTIFYPDQEADGSIVYPGEGEGEGEEGGIVYPGEGEGEEGGIVYPGEGEGEEGGIVYPGEGELPDTSGGGIIYPGEGEMPDTSNTDGGGIIYPGEGEMPDTSNTGGGGIIYPDEG